MRKAVVEFPSPEELYTVNQYVKRRGLSLVSSKIFRRSLQLALYRTVKPPSKRHLGTNLRSIDPLPCIPSLFHELTSTARGLPAKSPVEGISRFTRPNYAGECLPGELIPDKETVCRRLYKVRLQRQDSVASICRFQDLEFSTRRRAGELCART